MFRCRFEDTLRHLNIQHCAFSRNELFAVRLPIDLRTAEAWKDQRLFSDSDRRAIEFRDHLHGEAASSQSIKYDLGGRRRAGKVSAHREKNLRVAIAHRCNAFDGIKSVASRNREVE